jgi:hypothetical protein
MAKGNLILVDTRTAIALPFPYAYNMFMNTENIRYQKVLKISSLCFVAILYFRFGVGALTLDFWVLAVAVFIATISLVLGINKISRDMPAYSIIFWGTLLAFIAHIPITAFEDDESPIFLIALAIAPAVAGIIWLTHYND